MRIGRQYNGSPYTIESLLARRALNPARFDHYHPQLGQILKRDLLLRAICRPGQHLRLLPDTPHTRYLKWRRSLNPQRFDHYHPVLGPILAEDDRLLAGPCPLSPEQILPPLINPPTPGGPVVPPIFPPGGGTTTGGNNPPFGPEEIAIPEPSGLVLLLIGSISALLARWGAWPPRRRS
ncbi:MAG: hypothetical protein IRY99_10530 [Isosphaeraceae bacterium]|nr:hypothetical protein [Isosphaeraceae bacterium]